MAAGEAVVFLPTRTVISSGHACCKGGESSMSFGSSSLFGSGSYSSGKLICSGHNTNGKCGRRPRRSAVVRAELMQASRPMRSFENRTSTPVEEVKKLTLITAIKTPYLEDGRFDLPAFDRLTNLQIQNGVEGVIVGGTTGEGQLMNWTDHIMLIGHACVCFGDKIKVIGNVGSNATWEAVYATEQGFAVGMAAALHINPYYGKTSSAGVLAHFNSVLDMGPTVIYNVPGRTGQDISPAIIEKIAGHCNFAGVKECMGNQRVESYTKQGITIWSGNDDECHDARWDYGAQGVISVVSNLVPGLMHQLLLEGRDPKLNAKLQPLIKWLFMEPNPIGLNTALSQLGLIQPVFRLPYVPLGIEQRQQFVQIVEDIGRQHFVGDKDVQVLEDDDFLLLHRY
ncbi:unnamed protein product [Sphagnum troendelagicum]|uniref:4-hydroxy-tetrahydrodipicolinate synthase n=1 Tax=Sphagnum troendelagicum TaxID=128251 RepID=A0ABP0UIK2_9BRYO